jgi:phenylalanyl-tRNA synthetase beta chain
VARIHGYDNIEAVMPTIMTQYNKNEIWSKMDVLRADLVGLGFSETINYSFIPSNMMNILGIEPADALYSDLMLQNPIAGAYSLMRPTMVFSLLNCLAYNYSIGNSNLGLFELGRVYFKDSNYDTGCREVDTCAFIMSGVRAPRGWGYDKDVKYNYYDLLNYVKVLFDGFGQKFELKPKEYKFCEEGSCYNIVVNNMAIGFIGELNKQRLNKIQNVKLIKDKVFCCEFYIKDITERVKKIEFESKYPPVKRLYNLVHKKNICSAEIAEIIKSSGEIVRSVVVKDLYEDKNLNENEHAVLYEVNYCSKTSTLTSEKIESIENNFLKTLSEKFEIRLKD